MSKERLVAGAPAIDAATISELCHAIEELVSRRKRREEFEGLIDEAKTLANKWKDPVSATHPKDRRPLFDGTSTDTNFLLAALVVLLRRDHELLERIRRHFPNEVQKLSDDSLMADIMAAASMCASTRLQRTANQKYERKRRRWRRNFFSSIEYQFGGAAEAERRKPPLALHGLPYQPICLDDIFAGETVNMLRLEDLFFGIERHRLGNAVQGVQKRRYGYRAVVKIMESLLSEDPRKRRKNSTAGRPSRPPWLNDADLRPRALSGIEGRINNLAKVLMSIALEETDVSKLSDEELQFVSTVFGRFRGYSEWQRGIADAFLPVVRQHLPDSGKQ